MKGDFEYKLTVGLEIHAELKTRTKMFCDSKNDPDETRPNVNVCPICMGHPGTLPVINKEAVKHVLKVGVALGGELADFTEFDRKNYFYPDIPKGYQISQYKYPLVSGGSLQGITITRIHLEEDTGTSEHESGDGSLINFNRAGVPLMELVTEPVIHSAKDAVAFAKELQLLLRTLGVADANMEKGEMRVEANISVSKTDEFGTKVEVKNLNSFRAVERAIEFEMKRHIDALEKGEKIIQETRGWDENAGKTFSQRQKESSHDYRYFPDPDLPKLIISEIPEFGKEALRKESPELPSEKRERLAREYGIKTEDVDFYVTEFDWGTFFERAAKELGGDTEKIKLASNYIISDLVGLAKSSSNMEDATGVLGTKITPVLFAILMRMVSGGEISSRGAKDILACMYKEGGDPKRIAEEKGLFQKSDEGALLAIVEKVIERNPEVVSEYKGGKEASLQYLVGQGMKESRGSANPGVLKKLLIEKIGV